MTGHVIIVFSYQKEEKHWEKAESGSYSQFPLTELHRMMPKKWLFTEKLLNYQF